MRNTSASLPALLGTRHRNLSHRSEANQFCSLLPHRSLSISVQHFLPARDTDIGHSFFQSMWEASEVSQASQGTALRTNKRKETLSRRKAHIHNTRQNNKKCAPTLCCVKSMIRQCGIKTHIVQPYVARYNLVSLVLETGMRSHKK